MGCRLTVKPLESSDKYETETGAIIHKTQQTKAQEEQGAQIGQVLAMGDHAYLDSDTGKWCKVGDWIVWGRYAGYPLEDARLGKVWLVNDTDVLAVLEPADE